ncbi:hypothetical protein [Bradyrhizobium canariense]|uniref:hypothetical protein n=1 Tax=Bradyrhizobium canariense TaxID=255045 RepID=UPI000C23150E|nr:hypothetical protein [Bradyrhizobium canariense]
MDVKFRFAKICEGLRAVGNAVMTELAASTTRQATPARSESGSTKDSARFSRRLIKIGGTMLGSQAVAVS